MPKVRGLRKRLDPARREAVRLLERIENDQAYVNRLTSAGLTDELEPEAGRRATEYVAGVTRWRRWLDFLLAQNYRGRYESMEPRLRQILRLGSMSCSLRTHRPMPRCTRPSNWPEDSCARRPGPW